jgi:hypothetical protein
VQSNLGGDGNVPAPRFVVVFPDEVFQPSFNRDGTSIVNRDAE